MLLYWYAVESTYGEGYNTQKFLQENELGKYSRNEPLNLISAENQDLNQVNIHHWR